MKSMKKMVLVGLVLLASVMILVGCKMEAGDAKVYTFPAAVKVLTDYESPNNTGSEWTYVEFGEWPQSEAKDVEENSLKLVDGGRGYFKDNYYKDDNDNYYVKHNDSYYKVEPIVWRVLNKDYSGTGTALLLAEKILTGGIPYYGKYISRTIGGVEIFPNNYEHSQIRAFLNGLSYAYKESDSTEQIEKNEYEDAGFLQTAFTDEDLKCIAETTVDNTATSTIPNTLTEEEKRLNWNEGKNDNACDNTSDKIFLLSMQEATTAGYGFGVYTDYGEGTRIRVATDYADRRTYVGRTAGDWCLRSPDFYYRINVNYIFDDGRDSISDVTRPWFVVPALCIKLQ